MSANDGGGPAFPHANSANGYSSEGMSLRDWFAGQSISGLIEAHRIRYRSPPIDTLVRDTAEASYAMADAMLAARKVQP